MSDEFEKAMVRADELDERRRLQIQRQKDIINRLLAENQLMLRFVEKVSDQEGRLLGLRDEAKSIADRVEQMRGKAEEDVTK